ncbi:MAG TPA: DciA family protein [Pyrinomonadaceae bacterium]|jgi:hypothetical protein|nr:DciA family protein [Pyrinomonadaceae bacterium]
MEQLFAALPSVLKELGPNADVTEQIVFAAWIKVAGEMLNNRTKPIQYFENRLVVAVEDQNWQRNLESLAPEMVAKLNAATGHGTVKFVEFRIDKRAVTRSRNSEPLPSVAALPDSLQTAADGIADEQLRRSFLEAAAAYLKN